MGITLFDFGQRNTESSNLSVAASAGSKPFMIGFVEAKVKRHTTRQSNNLEGR
jgi:hypothetical protein